jgi:GH25 family lysozyme M1 (1,4-beta-N-acetylmuramidase)
MIPTGMRVTARGIVTGRSWRTECAGRTVSGNRWYRISAIAGRSVRSLYGVTYLYAATGLFRAAKPIPQPSPPPSPTPPPMPGTLEGIDVSHWQGVIDWPTVRSAGKHFAFLKASEDDDFVDDTYAWNRAEAKAAGLKVGAYHFARPETAAGDAIAEADHFLATAGPVSGELRPVLDLEVTGGLSDPQLHEWVKAYLGRIYERTGVRGVIYVSPNFWENNMLDSTWFASNGYDVLWIAHWTTAAGPSVPAGGWGSHGWTFWQYTSDGRVPGIAGRVDLDRFNGTDLSGALIP